MFVCVCVFTCVQYICQCESGDYIRIAAKCSQSFAWPLDTYTGRLSHIHTHGHAHTHSSIVLLVSDSMSLWHSH